MGGESNLARFFFFLVVTRITSSPAEPPLEGADPGVSVVEMGAEDEGLAEVVAKAAVGEGEATCTNPHSSEEASVVETVLEEESVGAGEAGGPEVEGEPPPLQ